MHILYITNDWNTTKVHLHLIKNLAQNTPDLEITVYVPLRLNEKIDNISDLPINVNLIPSDILRKKHKYLYSHKIKKIYRDILNKVGSLKDIDLIHTSNQCVCGAVALKFKIEFNIPYITAIRATDEYYYKKIFWRRAYFNRILNEASQIIFISKAYKEKYLKKVSPTDYLENVKKSLIIQNGIDDIFLNDRKFNEKTCAINIVYYGHFIPRKNLESLIYAVEMLRQKGYLLTLTAIGQKKDDTSSYNQLISKLASERSWISLQERKEIKEICDILAKFDLFAMVSRSETFGLVYIEALSQGLPILYTKDIGIDGYFPDGLIGKSCSSDSIEDIASQLEYIINHYTKIISNINKLDLESFRWEVISDQYITLYHKIILSNSKDL